MNEDPLDRLTPYGAVRGFLRAANRGDYSRAAEYLNVLTTPARARELATQLERILDFGLSDSLDHLAHTPEGDLKDGLPKTRDRVGSVETASAKLDIFLDRVQRRNEPAIWLFSSQTLKAVPKIYEAIGTPPLAQLLPQFLRTTRVLTVPLWQWLAIALGLALALSLASLVTRAFIPLLGPLIRRITSEADDRRLLSLRAPIRLVLLAVAIRILSGLSTSLMARLFWTRLSMIIATVGFAWLVIQLSDIVSHLSSRRLLRRGAAGKLAIVALGRRLFKIAVVLSAALFLLHRAGVNVTAMLAGLGVGGIALAFAAQKTLENFFGGISLIMREVIRVGDFCKVANQLGTIEDIGLGSTRLRTLDRTVLSVPNAQISQMELENISMRDKFWFHHLLGLRRETSPEQMSYVLAGIDQMLRGHPKVELQTARVRFIEFGSSSFDLEIFAYLQEKDYESFLRVQQELLLSIIDIVVSSGTKLALPSGTTYLKRDKQGSITKDESSRRDGAQQSESDHASSPAKSDPARSATNRAS